MPRGPRLTTLLVAAAGCTIVLAGCGSSGKPSGSSDASNESVGIKYADCMRSHGVPNFPDPGPGGGVQIGAGINPQSPAFQSAQSKCSSLMPGPGGGPAPASEALKVRMLREAQCMRAHGLPSFPDPTASRPSPSEQGGLALAFGHPGSFIAIPKSLVDSPAFNHAAARCGLPGAHGIHGAKANFAAAPG